MPVVAPEEPKPVPYTLRIGVIGHRSLPDSKAVAVTTERLLKNISLSLASVMTDPHQPQSARQTKWQCFESHLTWKLKRMLVFAKIMHGETVAGHRTPINFNVISSLAKGADRIVAKVAMDHLSASLKVVAPFNIDEYRKDFEPSGDLNEFNELFEKSENKHNLIQEEPPSIGIREDGYERAGKEVVDSCEILIAVWDGLPARGKGGTAEIVEYACSINRMVVWINALDPTLPVLIVTRVIKPETLTKSDVNAHYKVASRPLPRIAAGWSSRFVQIAEYNRDKAFNRKGFESTYNDYREKLESERERAGLLSEYAHPVLNLLLPHYARADYLAICYQKIHIKAATWLYRLAAIAVAIAVLQTLYAPHHTWWIALEIIALIFLLPIL